MDTVPCQSPGPSGGVSKLTVVAAPGAAEATPGSVMTFPLLASRRLTGRWSKDSVREFRIVACTVVGSSARTIKRAGRTSITATLPEGAGPTSQTCTGTSFGKANVSRLPNPVRCRSVITWTASGPPPRAASHRDPAHVRAAAKSVPPVRLSGAFRLASDIRPSAADSMGSTFASNQATSTRDRDGIPVTTAGNCRTARSISRSPSRLRSMLADRSISTTVSPASPPPIDSARYGRANSNTNKTTHPIRSASKTQRFSIRRRVSWRTAIFRKRSVPRSTGRERRRKIKWATIGSATAAIAANRDV